MVGPALALLSGSRPRPLHSEEVSLAFLGPVLGALDQASVVGHDFVLWKMKCEL